MKLGDWMSADNQKNLFLIGLGFKPNVRIKTVRMKYLMGLMIIVFHLFILYTITCPGYPSDLVPPFPIPNKEVKRVSADDTHSKAELGKVGRSQRRSSPMIHRDTSPSYSDPPVADLLYEAS